MPAVGDTNGSGSAARVWDREASSYDAARQNDPVYHSCIRQAVAAIPVGTGICLDAGCGTGLTTAGMLPRCDLVIAVDYSLDSLEQLTRKKLANTLAVQADLQLLPFPDSLFDASLCANTLQHLRPGKPQRTAIAELRRVTREDGVLSVSVHHYSRSKRKNGWVKEGKPGQAEIDYIFRFSREDLRSLVPEGTQRAIGYYGLSRVPWLGSRFQDLAARLFGQAVALLRGGHMLLAVFRNRKDAGE